MSNTFSNNKNSYAILLDVQKIVNRMEDKTDKRICLLEERVNTNEARIDKAEGKAEGWQVGLSYLMGIANFIYAALIKK